MQIAGINSASFNTRKIAPSNKLGVGKNLSFGAIKHTTYNDVYSCCPDYNGAEPDSKVLNTLRALPKGSVVADIGAGDGRNTLALAKQGLSVEAFEICPVGRRLITNRSQVLGLSNVTASEEDILKNPFGKKFDAATMAHVSQHFTGEELDVALENISKSLNSGGILIFDALIEKSGLIGPNSIMDVKKGHCHFPMTAIEKSAEKYGFSVKEVSSFDEKLSSRGDYYRGEWGYGESPNYLGELCASYLSPEQQLFNALRGTRERSPATSVRPVELKWIVLEKK